MNAYTATRIGQTLDMLKCTAPLSHAPQVRAAAIADLTNDLHAAALLDEPPHGATAPATAR